MFYRCRTKAEIPIGFPSSHKLAQAELLKSKTNAVFTRGVLSFVKAFNLGELSSYELDSR